MRPPEQVAAGVGLGPGPSRCRPVELEPAREAGVRRRPGHRLVVRVPRRDEATWAGHPCHLPEQAHRVADVLQDLVGVDDVEGVVSEGQRHGVRHLEAGPDVTRVDRRLPRQPHDRLRGVDADDLAGGDPLREVERDRARTAPDVEHPHAGSQVGGEVGR